MQESNTLKGPKIRIVNLQKIYPLNLKEIKKIAKKIIRYKLNNTSLELSLCFVDDKKIKELNRKFLKRNSPTDVLAFRIDAAFKEPHSYPLLGEIIISVETALKNAKTYNMDFFKELTLYLIHGILHLLGYQDKTPREKSIMQKEEQKIFANILRC